MLAVFAFSNNAEFRARKKTMNKVSLIDFDLTVFSSIRNIKMGIKKIKYTMYLSAISGLAEKNRIIENITNEDLNTG